jgi:DNA-binding GntR family transcriptional regulator
MHVGTWVYEDIKAQILDGKYAFGESLSVEVLSKQLSVSKQPVLQALRLLAAEGLVTIIPQVGCRVARYSMDEIKDFLRIFAANEGAIAELAATRRTDRQLASLGDIQRRLHQVRPRTRALGGATEGDDNDVDDIRRLNRLFHETIHEMANARIVSDVSKRLWDMREFVIFQTAIERDEDLLSRTHHDHANIFEAIRDKDAALARTEAEHHVLSILKFLTTDESGQFPQHR